MMKHHKILIYQIFTRLFGNRSYNCVENGTLAENGCGKMSFFDDSVLRRIKKLGVTHVWYTGVIRHASKTDYSAFGIPCQHPAVVKGRAGSPYAIVDYYDIDPDLADDVDRRMEEFEALLQRSHKAGLKVIIDFVPNHVARQYKSVKKPDGVKDFGETDDVNKGFYPDNNFYYCPNESFAPYFDLKGARIYHVWTDVNYRKKGIAIMLMEKAEQICNLSECEIMVLNVANIYNPAVRLYKKVGFKEFRIIANLPKTFYLIQMIKQIKGEKISKKRQRVEWIISKVKFRILYKTDSSPTFVNKIYFNYRTR